MSLFLATIATGLFLIVLGAIFLWNGKPVETGAKGFLRSPVATVILFGSSALWFLWHVAHLGEADFGNLKNILLFLFGGIALGSFFVVKDFLAVRGVAVLILLTARVLLDAAYMEEPTSRLFLVTFVYISIVVALYLGTVPFKLRDFFKWLFESPFRPKLLGGVLAVYGLLLTGVAFGY